MYGIRVYVEVEIKKRNRSAFPPSPMNWTYLLNILKHHISMPIKRLDPSQQFLIIPQTNQDLRLIPDCLL
jgi:hypothetical protein